MKATLSLLLLLWLGAAAYAQCPGGVCPIPQQSDRPLPSAAALNPHTGDISSAVVRVKMNETPRGQRPRPGEGVYGGSGVSIHAPGGMGFILTAAHVTEGARTATVEFWDGRQYQASVIAQDAHIDVAALAFRANDAIPKTNVAKIDPVPGQAICKVGYPADNGTSRANIQFGACRDCIDGIYTTTACYSGDSGGGWFTNDGALVGIVSRSRSGQHNYSRGACSLQIGLFLQRSCWPRIQGPLPSGPVGPVVPVVPTLPPVTPPIIATPVPAGPSLSSDFDAIKKSIAELQQLVKENKGEKGDRGEVGKSGASGDRGPVGPSGVGLVGATGPVGEKGRDGIDGKNGVDGKNGRDGKDGNSADNAAIIARIEALESQIRSQTIQRVRVVPANEP